MTRTARTWQVLDTAAIQRGTEPLLRVQLSQLQGGGSIIGITASHIVSGACARPGCSWRGGDKPVGQAPGGVAQSLAPQHSFDRL